MSGMFNPIIFYSLAVAIVLAAIFSICFKNIFYSLLSAILVFFATGVLFYVLGSEYNAIIQIAIYGVAVPVVLGLAIMFTETKPEGKQERKDFKIKFLLFLFAGLFILTMIYLTMTSLMVNPISFEISENISNTSVKVISSFASGIFTRYVWAFELVSLILTIVVVGLTLLGRKEEECKK